MNLLCKAASVCLLSGLSLAHAGTAGVKHPAVEVEVPCEISGWDFAMQAISFQANYSNRQIFSAFTTSSATRLNKFPIETNWGFKVEGSHHFGMGNDITVNWYHYSKESEFDISQSIQDGPATLNMTLKPKWDAVNAEFGQLVELGPRKTIHFHAGAQFARISTDYYQTIHSSMVTDRLHMKFNGVGPRLGLDYAYHWGNGFEIYAKGATAVLAGDSQFNTATTGAINLATGVTKGSKKALVPEVEGKLGVQYQYVRAQGNLNFEAGYLWQNYFGVQSAVVGTAGNSMGLSLAGPYLGIKYMGYV